MTNRNDDKVNVPGSSITDRDVYLNEKERKETEARLRRKEQQEDQSLKEGVRFLFKSVVEFIFYVAIGAFMIIFARDLLATNYPGGILLMMVGAGLIVKGMMTLGGYNSK